MKIEFPVKLEELKISLDRDMCYGPCPVYQVEVDGYGNVTFNGEYHVMSIGEHKAKISKKKVFRLFRRAMEIDFFNLSGKYELENIYKLENNDMINKYESMTTDLPTYIVTIKIGEKEKRVSDYLGAPKRLRSFENLIDKVCGTDKWIGKTKYNI